MPAIAAIAASDGTATRTFNPDRIELATNIAKHLNRAGGIPVGYDQLDFQVIKASGKSTVDRVILHLALPTLAQTSPSSGSGIQPNPTVAYTHRVKVEFFMPIYGTAAERVFINTLLKNVLAVAAVDTAIETVESFY
jgi:hypothetical protein